ncbi:hypothetical protein FO519_002906 [Halicephalobus sp. NKZ332]|nr:hypothetical protein FO519_002906 [Halicephalobus sp. NKZ332]
MYTEGFKPPRPGGIFKGNEFDVQTYSQREFDSRITPYRNPVEVEDKYRDNRFYDEDLIEYERIDCTPGMCGHPYSLLRWFEMIVFFVLHWLIQITCARTTCTMILTEFGYKAYGQAFILCVIVLLAACCTLILIAYSMNFHKAKPELILGFERLYAIGGISLMVVCGIVGSYHAATTTDPEINSLGRGESGIRPQWIIAAVLEFLTAVLFVFDLLGQNRDGFPFVYSRIRKADNIENSRRQREEFFRRQRMRESYY